MHALDAIKLVVLLFALFGNALLALAVYRTNFRSITNILYGLLSIVISLWLLVNYISIVPSFSSHNLLLIRLSIFFATPMSLLFFLLTFHIPDTKLRLQKWILILIAIITTITMVVTLSPYTFTGIQITNNSANPIPGPGLILFALVTNIYSLLAVFVLIRKVRRTKGEEHQQFKLVMWGILTMLGLIIGTIFLPVVFFQFNFFVSLIPLYALIFLGATAYAITKHHLFEIKVIATEMLAMIIWVILFAKIFVAQDISEQAVDIFILLISIIFGVLLIRSVRSEVKQREKLEILTKELEAANAKLQQADRMKTQFLSFASHQVKSPITVVKDYASLILDGTYGAIPDKVHEIAQKIKDSSNRMIALVNNLLDLRRLEEGKVEYNFEDFSLTELVKSVADELQTLAKNKNLAFECVTPPDDIKIKGDKEKLRQVFQNLLDNSVKYTETGWIKIELKTKDDSAVVTVSDSGLGIPADVMPSLFEQFVRGSNETKKILGTGLGLYIARQFMKAHGGDIVASSDGAGKGSLFTVTLKKL